MGFEKSCMAVGCAKYPAFGFQQGARAQMRWACLEHRGLLELGAARPAAGVVPQVGEGENGLYPVALPLPGTVAQGKLL
jgi:hypothetical protein